MVPSDIYITVHLIDGSKESINRQGMVKEYPISKVSHIGVGIPSSPAPDTSIEYTNLTNNSSSGYHGYEGDYTVIDKTKDAYFRAYYFF